MRARGGTHSRADINPNKYGYEHSYEYGYTAPNSYEYGYTALNSYEYGYTTSNDPWR